MRFAALLFQATYVSSFPRNELGDPATLRTVRLSTTRSRLAATRPSGPINELRSSVTANTSESLESIYMSQHLWYTVRYRQNGRQHSAYHKHLPICQLPLWQFEKSRSGTSILPTKFNLKVKFRLLKHSVFESAVHQIHKIKDNDPVSLRFRGFAYEP